MSSTLMQAKGAKAWELNVPKKQHYSSDEVIEAYFKGKEVGKADGLREGSEASKQLFLKALTENLARAGQDTGTVLKAFKAQNLKVEKAMLRIDSWHRFSVMVVTSEKAFGNPKLLKVYDTVNQLEDAASSHHYQVRFSFVAGGDALDTNALHADGYLLKFNA